MYAHPKRATESPATPLESATRIVIFDIRRQLKRLAGFFRRVNETQKFPRLAPKISRAAPGNVFQTARVPVRDGSKNSCARRNTTGFPEISHNGLSRRQPLEPMQRHRKVLRYDVFAKRKERAMPLQTSRSSLNSCAPQMFKIASASR